MLLRVPATSVLAAVLLVAAVAHADDPGWPREIQVDGYKIVVYQPQPESFAGNALVSRAAVSVTPTGKTPVFGAVWMNSRVETDRDARIVTVTNVTVERVRFPDATEEQQAQLSTVLGRHMTQWELEMSLDRLTASLDAVGSAGDTEGLAFDPPNVVYRQVPAVLVTIEGEPRLQTMEGSDLARVVNTPFLIVQDGDFFLYAGTDAWYTAAQVMGPWTYTASVPPAIAALAPDESGLELPGDEEAADSGAIPEIIVATEPTELIYTDGEPAYTPIGTGELMYVSNTDSTVILDVASQEYYILLAGRWYSARTAEGPWEYHRSDQLPDAFANIEKESEISDVRAHVAGTDEANDAVLDAMIPQTAEVERGRAELEIEYDGDPQFEAIPGTAMEWAKNTSAQVLKAEGRYWAVSDGVWYVANSATGPWEVADARPAETDAIPADNPNHNCKYVYVFDSTPEVVYVGYTPGYTSTYVYGGAVVYGTGYYYPAWYGSYYYPRVSTWGFGVRYNPYTGWSFGVTYSNGRFTFGIGFGGYGGSGWWGPAGYHGYWRGYRRGYYHGWNRGFYNGARAGYRAGARAGYRQSNIYNNRPQPRPVRTAQPRATNRAINAPNAVSRTQQNNVFADRNGDVFRRDSSGNWEQRAGGNWQSAGQAATRAGEVQRPTTAQRPSSASRLQGLERQSLARSRGTQKSNSFRASSSRISRGGSRRRR
jgi:hypothetical protein